MVHDKINAPVLFMRVTVKLSLLPEKEGEPAKPEYREPRTTDDTVLEVPKTTAGSPPALSILSNH